MEFFVVNSYTFSCAVSTQLSVCVHLTPSSSTSSAPLALVPRLQMSHWSRCRSHHRPLLPLSPRRRVKGDVAAKRGADGVMKGQRGCLGLISALILATAGSVYAVRVSGISHQHRLQNVCKTYSAWRSTAEIHTIFVGINNDYSLQYGLLHLCHKSCMVGIIVDFVFSDKPPLKQD